MTIDEWVMLKLRAATDSIKLAYKTAWAGTMTIMWILWATLVVRGLYHSIQMASKAPINRGYDFVIVITILEGLFWFIMLYFILAIPIGYVRLAIRHYLSKPHKSEDIFPE